MNTTTERKVNYVLVPKSMCDVPAGKTFYLQPEALPAFRYLRLGVWEYNAYHYRVSGFCMLPLHQQVWVLEVGSVVTTITNTFDHPEGTCTTTISNILENT